jgi:YVTN family beta-propeller protein
MLRIGRRITVPGSAGGAFDHGAFEPETGLVFLAHTSRDAVEVMDPAGALFVQSIPGFSAPAGVAAGAGIVLVTSRGSDEVVAIDAKTCVVTSRHRTGISPNGVALAPRTGIAVIACLGSDTAPPTLERINLASGDRQTLPLPGRPRWCVVDAAEAHVYCAINEPSMVFVADLAPLVDDDHWLIPAKGAHGIDLDEFGKRLYVSCDEGRLLAVSAVTGAVEDAWPLPGRPDATWFNPGAGRVHVSIGDPGCIVTVTPGTHGAQVASVPTGPRAKTSALIIPDRVFAFLPKSGEALELIESAEEAKES